MLVVDRLESYEYFLEAIIQAVGDIRLFPGSLTHGPQYYGFTVIT
jgi:hypothetical protein